MLGKYLYPGSTLAAVAAAGVGVVVEGGYVLQVRAQGTEIGSGGLFLVAFVGVMAALSLGSAAVGKQHELVAQALLYGATSGYLVAGLVGLASIGLFLIVAGLLALIAAGPRRVSTGVVATVVAISASVFLIGMALT